MRDVGKRVAELRTERGLTQEECAVVLRRSKGHLQRIEHGDLNLTLRSLLHLADHFDVTVADLFATPRTRVVRRGRPPGPKT